MHAWERMDTVGEPVSQPSGAASLRRVVEPKIGCVRWVLGMSVRARTGEFWCGVWDKHVCTKLDQERAFRMGRALLPVGVQGEKKTRPRDAQEQAQGFTCRGKIPSSPAHLLSPLAKQMCVKTSCASRRRWRGPICPA